MSASFTLTATKYGLSSFDTQAAEDRLDRILFAPRLGAAQLQDERLRLVARLPAGDAERPAGMRFVAVPLRGDGAHLAVVRRRTSGR